jgi:hypothetical protein
MIGAAGRTFPAGLGRRPRQPEKDKPMLRKFAVVLLAASVFTAPVLAQGGGSAATPPAKTENSATPKVVTANPSLESAKVKPAKRYARHHRHHVKHAAHVKRVKQVKSAHAVQGTKGDKPMRESVSKSTTGQSGATPAPKAKSNVN